MRPHYQYVQTPLWVPLVVAGIGVLGTIIAGIAGVLITQRRSDRREDLLWKRDHQRELERWKREDVTRTFEQRRQAYVDFYQSLQSMARTAYDHGYGFTPEPELPSDWHASTFARLQHLRIYATPSVTEAASAAYGAAWGWGDKTKYDDPDDPAFYERQDMYDAAEHELLDLIRVDLSIPSEELADAAA